jgi:hypothetical protein
LLFQLFLDPLDFAQRLFSQRQTPVVVLLLRLALGCLALGECFRLCDDPRKLERGGLLSIVRLDEKIGELASPRGELSIFRSKNFTDPLQDSLNVAPDFTVAHPTLVRFRQHASKVPNKRYVRFLQLRAVLETLQGRLQDLNELWRFLVHCVRREVVLPLWTSH